MQTVFVTGATGFVGRRFVQHLRRQGYAVKVLSRLSGDPELESLGIDWIQGDLLKPASYIQRIEGVDWVFHLAADTRSSKKANYARNNIDATQLLLHSLERLSIPPKRFIFTSSIAAVDRAITDLSRRPLDASSLPHPRTEYARSKLACEKIVSSSSLAWTILRPAFVVGPNMKPQSALRRLATSCIRSAPSSLIQWPGALSLLHVDDLCEALLFAARSPQAVRETYFVSGETLPIAEILRQFRKILKKPAPPIPGRWLRKVGELFLPVLSMDLRFLLFPTWTADDRPFRDLGWTPKVPTKQALKQIAEQKAERQKPLPPRTE